MPAISSRLDETIDQLDRLNQASRDRVVGDFAKLQGIVAGLETPFDPTLDAEAAPELARGRRPDGSRSPASDGGTLPFGVELPQRTTHGGPFGPAVRRRLIAEAQDRGDW